MGLLTLGAAVTKVHHVGVSDVLAYVAVGVVGLWGVAHVLPTARVLRGFNKCRQIWLGPPNGQTLADAALGCSKTEPDAQTIQHRPEPQFVLDIGGVLVAGQH